MMLNTDMCLFYTSNTKNQECQKPYAKRIKERGLKCACKKWQKKTQNDPWNLERGSKPINAATDNCCAFSTKANQNAPGEL